MTKEEILQAEIADLKSQLLISEQKVKLNYNALLEYENNLNEALRRIKYYKSILPK